jgi:hypothetical protein
MLRNDYKIIGHEGVALKETASELPIVWHCETDSVCVFGRTKHLRDWQPRLKWVADPVNRWTAINEVPLPVECLNEGTLCYVTRLHGQVRIRMEDGGLVSVEPLIVHRVRIMNYEREYGRLGTVHREYHRLREADAAALLRELVIRENDAISQRDNEQPPYALTKVGGVSGWLSSEDGAMFVLDSFEVLR